MAVNSNSDGGGKWAVQCGERTGSPKYDESSEIVEAQKRNGPSHFR
jgi:hypothetical protein